MIFLIKISLIINILVLVPVCLGFYQEASWLQSAYGVSTSARGILFSVYLAILICSLALLFYTDTKLVFALLVVQVLYKVTTPLTVGSFANPVVMSNLMISAVHFVTVMTIIYSGGLSGTK